MPNTQELMSAAATVATPYGLSGQLIRKRRSACVGSVRLCVCAPDSRVMWTDSEGWTDSDGFASPGRPDHSADH